MLAAAALLLTMAVADASASQVISGQAGALYRQNENASGASSGTPSSSTPASSAPVTPASSATQGNATFADLEAIGKSMGWSGSQLAAWWQVITLESGGRLTAQNPTSNAYGIAQFINGASEYYTYGGNPDTVTGQLTAMANYIKQRYGTPTAALAHENANHWY